MARPRRETRPEPIVDVLLARAAEAFGASGYEAARLEDIARAAGITRASVLYHFASKEALYEAVVEQAFDAMRSTLESALALDGGSFEHKLEQIVTALARFADDHVGLLSVVLRGCLRGDAVVARRSLERSLTPLVDALELTVGAAADVPSGFPVRAAILQLMFAHFVHASMGELGSALWRGEPQTLTLAKQLLAPAPIAAATPRAPKRGPRSLAPAH
jgi:AcrR family transcriptional regulator